MKKPTAITDHIYYYKDENLERLVKFCIVSFFAGFFLAIILGKIAFTYAKSDELISPIPDIDRVDKNPAKFKITVTLIPEKQTINLVPVAEAKVVNKPVEVVNNVVDYKSFIYFHESGNNPARVNSGGCVGLGQDCNGMLRTACPTLDYACEDQFFTDYMLRRYGSWEHAYQVGMSRGTYGINDGWGWW